MLEQQDKRKNRQRSSLTQLAVWLLEGVCHAPHSHPSSIAPPVCYFSFSPASYCNNCCIPGIQLVVPPARPYYLAVPDWAPPSVCHEVIPALYCVYLEYYRVHIYFEVYNIIWIFLWFSGYRPHHARHWKPSTHNVILFIAGKGWSMYIATSYIVPGTSVVNSIRGGLISGYSSIISVYGVRQYDR